MIVIPAIDIKDGKCVRLLQGRRDAVTIYSDDPVSVARRWVESGAELIHVVDLDGAFTGVQRNMEKIKAIRDAVDVQIQVGGGIRDLMVINELINVGIDRVIIGTVAVNKPEIVKEACERFSNRILIAVDAKDGKVAVKGWEEVTDVTAIEFAKKMQDCGITAIIYTDISRDGMLTGPNIEAMESMINALSIPVIVSGGVSRLEDIKALMQVKGLWGVITGKALYEGRLDLREAVELVRGNAC